MSIFIPDEGAIQLLQKSLKVALTVDENYTLKLFKNNHTPAAADTTASYTVANFTGYADITLSRGGWSTPTTVSGAAVSTYASQAFTSSDATPQTIYGYYVVGATSGKVLWAELLAASRTMNDTDVFTVNPKFGYQTYDC